LGADSGEALGCTVVPPQTGPRPEGDYPENAEGKEKNEGSKYTIDGTSFRVYDPRIVGALGRAINGRASFFKTHLRKGVFDKFDTIAAKYPGLNVNRD
jgi:hypothetical protein